MITITAFAFGSGTSRSLASSTMPSVPSEPTMILARFTGFAGSRKLVQVVAAHVAQDLRVAAVDLVGVLAGEAEHGAITGGFQRVAGRHLARAEFRGSERRCASDSATTFS